MLQNSFNHEQNEYHELMIITQAILDKLTEAAKDSPRLRMNMDLRDVAENVERNRTREPATDT